MQKSDANHMKTMHELREELSLQIDDLRNKKTTPSAVNAVCNATGKFLSTIKLEMEYAKMIGKQPSGHFLKLMDKPEVLAKKKAA